jgi:polyphenol oxidase
MRTPEFLHAEWRAPAAVRAVVTTRDGGASLGPYASFNLATHVGDNPANVATNRARLREALALPAEPAWLEQVHGTRVAMLPGSTGQADAAVAFEKGCVCAVLIADCLPIFLAARAGDRIGVAHAGWRGLAAGVVEATVAALDCDPASLVAWLGPSIGRDAFEVGAEVREAFMAGDPAAAREFRAGRAGRWLADLPALAKRRLAGAGVVDVQESGLCTYADPARFYSHRRDGTTGRMAALAWLA